MTLSRTIASAVSLAAAAQARGSDPALDMVKDVVRIVEMENHYALHRDIVYATAGDTDLKLNLYARNDGRSHPTVLYFHGGGWKPEFTKDMYTPALTVFLRMGWNVINAEYRSSEIALAPAAVHDAFAALKWVLDKAETYAVDKKQMVLMGHSAGGLLALMAAMAPAPGEPNVLHDRGSIAAIVNWYGVVDVADVAHGGPNEQPYAVMWLGDQADRTMIAKAASPLTYVRANLPPIITVHGDADPIVPFAQALRLHDALNVAGVVNKLVPISNGGHGSFGVDATQKAYVEVFDFLAQAGLTIQPHSG